MITEQIYDAYPKLRKSEKKAADYILSNSEKMDQLTLQKIAEKAQVSQPTIMRMLQKAGYSSFKEAKIAFIEERTQKETIAHNIMGMPLEPEDSIEDVPVKVIRNTISLLNDSLKSISSKQLKEAVTAIEKADKIGIFAVENSTTIATDLLVKLLYLGLNGQFNEDYYLQSLTAGHLTNKDVAIGISFTGTSRNTVEVMAQAKKAGATTIAITNFEDTPLVKYADIVIRTSDKQMLYGNDIFSRTIHLAVVDMIYMGLLVGNYEKYTALMKESASLIAKRK